MMSLNSFAESLVSDIFKQLFCRLLQMFTLNSFAESLANDSLNSFAQSLVSDISKQLYADSCKCYL